MHLPGLLIKSVKDGHHESESEFNVNFVFVNFVSCTKICITWFIYEARHEPRLVRTALIFQIGTLNLSIRRKFGSHFQVPKYKNLGCVINC